MLSMFQVLIDEIKEDNFIIHNNKIVAVTAFAS